jgi:hypothetical protein
MPSRSQIYGIVNAQCSRENVYVIEADRKGKTKVYSPSTQDNQRTSGFLRLPPEIRNRVYELASTGCSIRQGPFSIYSSNKVNNTDFAILQICRQICRQICHEATPIFFARAVFDSKIFRMQAIFELDSLARIRSMTFDWLAALHISRSPPIKEELIAKYAKLADAYSATFRGLERIYMHLGNWSKRQSDQEVRDAARRVFRKPELVVVCGVGELSPGLRVFHSG